jgi:hypothetical protein
MGPYIVNLEPNGNAINFTLRPPHTKGKLPRFQLYLRMGGAQSSIEF